MPFSDTPLRLLQLVINPVRAVNWMLRATKRAVGRDFTDNGERVDITYNSHFDFSRLDKYQKSHFRRYQFACGLLKPDSIVGDLACGTGYGTVMLGAAASQASGYDISPVICVVKKRYANIPNVSFAQGDILHIKPEKTFDVIVSFETVEHFSSQQIPILLKHFYSLLSESGVLIISTPYNQIENAASRKHHKAFYITPRILEDWLKESGFVLEKLYFQNYITHVIKEDLAERDFLIAICRKS